MAIDAFVGVQILLEARFIRRWKDSEYILDLS